MTLLKNIHSTQFICLFLRQTFFFVAFCSLNTRVSQKCSERKIYQLDWFRCNSPCSKITISQSESSTGLHSTSIIAWQILKLIIFVLHQPIFEVSLTAPPVVLFACVILVVSFPIKFNCVELAFLSDNGWGLGSGCVTYSFCFWVSLNSVESHHSFARATCKSGESWNQEWTIYRH